MLPFTRLRRPFRLIELCASVFAMSLCIVVSGCGGSPQVSPASVHQADSKPADQPAVMPDMSYDIDGVRYPSFEAAMQVWRDRSATALAQVTSVGNKERKLALVVFRQPQITKGIPPGPLTIPYQQLDQYANATSDNLYQTYVSAIERANLFSSVTTARAGQLPKDNILRYKLTFVESFGDHPIPAGKWIVVTPYGRQQMFPVASTDLTGKNLNEFLSTLKATLDRLDAPL